MTCSSEQARLLSPPALFSSDFKYTLNPQTVSGVRNGSSLFVMRKGPLFYIFITRVFASRETLETVYDADDQRGGTVGRPRIAQNLTAGFIKKKNSNKT